MKRKVKAAELEPGVVNQEDTGGNNGDAGQENWKLMPLQPEQESSIFGSAG